MCGRFTLSGPGDVVAAVFELAEVPPIVPRYNIAPTQPVSVVLLAAESSRRQVATFRWGLIPSWANDSAIGARMINARAETVAKKPSFRSAFRLRRCLVIADGFYEWQKLDRRKQPFHIRMRDGRPFAFAGLWERWKGTAGEVVDSCTLITTEPNELIAPLHNRMPAILAPESHERWLDPDADQPDALERLLRPYSADEMTAYPVGTGVNNPANDTSECIRPLA